MPIPPRQAHPDEFAVQAAAIGEDDFAGRATARLVTGRGSALQSRVTLSDCAGVLEGRVRAGIPESSPSVDKVGSEDACNWAKVESSVMYTILYPIGVSLPGTRRAPQLQ